MFASHCKHIIAVALAIALADYGHLSGHICEPAICFVRFCTYANFITLAQQGFFKDLKCHRLTTAGIYVLQCGDPNGDGTGGPGYNWGPIENAPFDSIYKTGVLAMARVGGDASSMGSQFFIVYEDSTIPSDAAGGYTVIGHITSGLPELIAQVTSQGTSNGSSDGAPKVPVTLKSVSVK